MSVVPLRVSAYLVPFITTSLLTLSLMPPPLQADYQRRSRPYLSIITVSPLRFHDQPVPALPYPEPTLELSLNEAQPITSPNRSPEPAAEGKTVPPAKHEGPERAGTPDLRETTPAEMPPGKSVPRQIGDVELLPDLYRPPPVRLDDLLPYFVLPRGPESRASYRQT
jgi:hypothetical protein